MAENVFVLGAGASVHAGAPLMNNFIEIAEDLLEEKKFDNETADMVSKILELKSELRKVYANSQVNLDNIEKLFGLVEMARVIGVLGNYRREDINRFRESLKTLIVKTLEHTIKYPVKDQRVLPTEVYNKFVKLISKNNDSAINTAIVTFNYDIALDYAFYWNSLPYTYCLQDNDRGYKLLKLHGSTNWAQSSNGIIPYNFQAYFNKLHFLSFDRKEIPWIFSKDLSTLFEEYPDLDFQPSSVIVPPTWNKIEYNGQLTKVWNNAAKELGSAKNIYIIGYSFPESDAFFQYLYALGTIDNSKIRKFCVVDPDPSGDVKRRYERILGTSLKGKFQFHSATFTQAISNIITLK